jgi:low affinity Fe/Cu permease
MVFLIQNTQNRDAKAAHLKLDEIIRALKGARNELIDLEKLADEDLTSLAAFGKWRDHRNIVLAKTKRVSVQSSKDIPATLDGEIVNLGTSAEINFVSRALTVLVPAK